MSSIRDEALAGSESDPAEPDAGLAERMLTAIGLGTMEAQLYAVLLDRPGATLDELAALLGLSSHHARGPLGLLERNGLVSRTPTRPARYIAAPADAAIEPLITQRQHDIQRARALAAELGERIRQATSASVNGQQVLELLTSHDAVSQRFQQLERTARTEILAFDRPAYYAVSTGENEGEAAALARGVSVRAVYASEALEVPGRLDHIRLMAERGEQARVFSRLPLKLFLFDRHTAMIPIRPLDAELTAGEVVIRTSALLDALYMFFELIWDRATPIPLDGGKPAPTDPPPSLTDDLVPLLAAGLTDDAIARQLGLSRRTVQRRIQALLSTVDARSRFQAGYRIGHQHAASSNPPVS
jgi:sugar-specific transcriptional regulator TrmB/AraC-like DNA-binding protein